MKRKILAMSVVVLSLTGLFLGIFVSDKITADVTSEWSKQNFVVNVIQTDVDGLEVEAVWIYDKIDEIKDEDYITKDNFYIISSNNELIK